MSIEITRSALDDFLMETHADIDIDSFRTYSGRGMCGERCLGLVGRTEDLIRFVMAVAMATAEGNEFAEEIVDEMAAVSSDSMGYDAVFYWTRIELIDDMADDE